MMGCSFSHARTRRCPGPMEALQSGLGLPAGALHVFRAKPIFDLSQKFDLATGRVAAFVHVTCDTLQVLQELHCKNVDDCAKLRPGRWPSGPAAERRPNVPEARVWRPRHLLRPHRRL